MRMSERKGRIRIEGKEAAVNEWNGWDRWIGRQTGFEGNPDVNPES